jgi:hypothetical protein
VRIGSPAARGLERAPRAPPAPHVFGGRPAASDSHARLMRPSRGAGCRLPAGVIPYTTKYFGEDGGEIACFTATAAVRVPEDYRGRWKGGRRDAKAPARAPSAPSPSPRSDGAETN